MSEVKATCPGYANVSVVYREHFPPLLVCHSSLIPAIYYPHVNLSWAQLQSTFVLFAAKPKKLEYTVSEGLAVVKVRKSSLATAEGMHACQGVRRS